MERDQVAEGLSFVTLVERRNAEMPHLVSETRIFREFRATPVKREDLVPNNVAFEPKVQTARRKLST